MSEGSFSTTVSAAGLSPAQRQQLDGQLRNEGIPVTWLGDSIQIDQAFESRVEGLVATARSAGPANGVAPGFVDTSQPAPLYPMAPQPAGYPQPGYYPMGPPQVANSNATIALILAIVGWAICPIASIFGVVYARRALDEIRASAGTQSGEGMAKGALIGSWIILGIWGLIIVGFLVMFIMLAIIGAASST